ncbi:MAG TPA: hypothetical protein EYP59_09050 [Thiotrichaceae bacterium]|nr:hypothetical protein [Thiotrichaceae bacterium]
MHTVGSDLTTAFAARVTAISGITACVIAISGVTACVTAISGVTACVTATAGIVTAGIVTAGIITAGIVTAGIVTAGIITTGIITAGIITTGIVTTGIITTGIVVTTHIVILFSRIEIFDNIQCLSAFFRSDFNFSDNILRNGFTVFIEDFYLFSRFNFHFLHGRFSRITRFTKLKLWYNFKLLSIVGKIGRSICLRFKVDFRTNQALCCST